MPLRGVLPGVGCCEDDKAWSVWLATASLGRGLSPFVNVPPKFPTRVCVRIHAAQIRDTRAYASARAEAVDLIVGFSVLLPARASRRVKVRGASDVCTWRPV